MKRMILLSGLVILMLSCNSGRIAELEAENNELKTTIVLCQEEAKIAQKEAEFAQEIAHIAQIRAEAAMRQTKVALDSAEAMAQRAAEAANK